MPSPTYQLIKDVIQDRHHLKAITARYKDNEVRKLFPHLLGTNPHSHSHGDEEVVLCYQFGGYSFDPIEPNHPSKANWRCFKVVLLEDVVAIPFNENWQPSALDLNKQCSVRTRDVHR